MSLKRILSGLSIVLAISLSLALFQNCGESLDLEALSQNSSTVPGGDPGILALGAEGLDGNVLSFGDVYVGSTESVDLIFQNVGEIDVTGIVISGLFSPITIVQNSCAQTAVASEGLCVVTLNFSPASAIAYSRNVSITYYDGVQQAARGMSLVVAGAGIAAPLLATEGPARIVSPPQSRFIVLMNPVGHTFAVTANGAATLTYQWYFKPFLSDTENAIRGATSRTYTISQVNGFDSGTYRVQVRNNLATVSASATLAAEDLR